MMPSLEVSSTYGDDEVCATERSLSGATASYKYMYLFSILFFCVGGDCLICSMICQNVA